MTRSSSSLSAASHLERWIFHFLHVNSSRRVTPVRHVKSKRRINVLENLPRPRLVECHRREISRRRLSGYLSIVCSTKRSMTNAKCARCCFIFFLLASYLIRFGWIFVNVEKKKKSESEREQKNMVTKENLACMRVLGVSE